jgi:hypothetical protein
MAQVSFINRRIFKKRRDGQVASAVFNVDSGSRASGVITSGGSAEDKVNRTGDTMTGELILDAGLQADVINENTAGAGVTIDGLLLRDGSVAGYYNAATIDSHGWDLYTTVLRDKIKNGDKLDFVGGTDMQVQYDEPNKKLTFDFVGTVGSMDRWYLLGDSGGQQSIQNNAPVKLIGGTNVTTSDVTWNTTDLRWEMTIDAAGGSDPDKVDVAGDTMTGKLTMPLAVVNGTAAAATGEARHYIFNNLAYQMSSLATAANAGITHLQ